MTTEKLPWQVHVQVDMSAVAMLEGAMECSSAGVSSSLLPQNARVAAWVSDADQVAKHPSWPLLLDPQTGAALSRWRCREHSL